MVCERVERDDGERWMVARARERGDEREGVSGGSGR